MTENWTLFATLKVEGQPKAQPRPRAFSRNGHARVFDEATAEGWKGLIALAAQEARPVTPLDEPVRIDTAFYFKRPKRLMRRTDPEGPVWHTAKPDRDNLDKAVLDTLKTIGFLRDDSIVCSGLIRKLYHSKTGRPGTVIRIFTLQSDRQARREEEERMVMYQ